MNRQLFPSFNIPNVIKAIKPSSTRSTLSLCFALFIVSLAFFLGYLMTMPLLSKAPAVEITSWRPTTSLPVALAGRNTVVHGSRLYVIGGKKADNRASRDIYSAEIDLAGTIGTWEIVGELPVDYYLFASVVVDDALFLVGGWNGSNTVPDVRRATFAADGRVVNWENMPPLPVAVDLHDIVFLDGHIYSVGGWDGLQPQQAIYAAAVTATGLSGWQLVGDLPKPLYRHAVAGADGYLYVTGGYDENGNAQATVLAAQVNGTSSLGNWQLPPALPMLTYYHNVVVHDGRLVVLGGRNDSTIYDVVYSAAIGANGLPGTWRAELSLPIPLHRFGTAVVSRNGSEYLFVAAGLRTDTAYQATVYHSTIPQPPTPTPTPTLTPTPTPSPTPTGALSLHLSNSPDTWIGPGEKVVYTIHYRNDGETTLDNVAVANAIPAGVELVPDSVQSSSGTFTVGGSQAGSVIQWEIGDVAANEDGEVAYAVQRPIPPTPVIPLALDITVDAPEDVDANEQVTYRFEVTNRAPIALTNLVVTNTLPVGAIYESGGDSEPTNGIVHWTVDRLAAETSTEVEYRVRAHSSLVNYDYRVVSGEGASANGRVFAVTIVDEQLPRVGDDFVIINRGATVTWGVGGQSRLTNTAYNPSFQLYLPSIQGGN